MSRLNSPPARPPQASPTPTRTPAGGRAVSQAVCLRCTLALCLLTHVAGAGASHAAETPETARAAIRADWDRAEAAYVGALDRARTAAERAAAAPLAPDRATFAGRFLRLADAHPGTPAELTALCWAALNAPDTDPGREATILLTTGGRIDRADLDGLLASLRAAEGQSRTSPRSLAPAVVVRVKRSLDLPPAARLLAWACAAYLGDDGPDPPPAFAVAADLIAERFAASPDVSHFAEALFMNGTPAWAGRYEGHLRAVVGAAGKPLVRATAEYAMACIPRAAGADHQGEAERRFRRFVADHDGRSGVEAQLVEMARGELARMERCGLGRAAQEVAGDDLDGRPLRLSDYRGRVVLLVFWASWCGPCLADVPHEKELVERFRGRPFVVVGVNGDRDRNDARRAVAKAGIPWRSVWDGPKNGGGPVATAWQVDGWPTVYVIDHAGVLRHDLLRGKRLDEPLERLVAAAEAAGKEKGR